MIGVIGTGLEQINIIQSLLLLEQDFCIIADMDSRPLQDRSVAYNAERIEKLLQYATTIGCTHSIINPSQELAVVYDNIDKHWQQILPIYNHYLTYNLQHSLVGKIGFIWWYADIQTIERIRPHIQHQFVPTDSQLNIKKFHNPLCKWTKETNLRELIKTSRNNRKLFSNTIIKHDLRYFKDANVDTIIPLNYGYLEYEKTIRHYCNPKKQKFHTNRDLHHIIRDIVAPLWQIIKNPILSVYYTWSLHLMQQNNLWASKISQWGKYTIEYKEMTII